MPGVAGVVGAPEVVGAAQLQLLIPHPHPVLFAQGHSFLEVLWKTIKETAAARIARDASLVPNDQPATVIWVFQTPMNAAIVRSKKRTEAIARTILQAMHSQQEEPHIRRRGKENKENMPSIRFFQGKIAGSFDEYLKNTAF